MELCTNLQQRVLDLETIKTTQANEIKSLKRRFKKLKRRNKSSTHGLKRIYRVGSSRRVESFEDEGLDEEDASKQGRKPIDAIAEDDNITLVSTQNVNEEIMFDVSDLAGEEVFVTEQGVPDSKKDDVVSTVGDATQLSTAAKIQDKGKEKMIEPEHVKKLLKKDQLMLNEEVAQRLQAREQEELTIEERAKLFQQPLEKRRKHFAAKRAEEKRNRPPTRSQQKNIICTYLKNMDGKKVKDLKNKSFDSIQKMFDKAFKRVNIFVDFRTKLVEGSSKRAGDELEQESTKKQKMDDVKETAKVDKDKETTKLQSLREVILDEEEVAVDAIPLAIKPPSTCLVNYSKALTGKIWKLCGGWLKLSMGIQGQQRALRECYGSTLYEVSKSAYLYVGREKVSPYTCYNYCILLVIMELLMKKPEILKKNIKFRGGLLGLKDFLLILELLLLRLKKTFLVNTTCTQLMLLVQKLLLLVLKVNAASIKVTTAGRVYADREEIKDLSEKE
ncbi:hypothetical protein Tco_0312272 [Tanacetum coccineum]